MKKNPAKTSKTNAIFLFILLAINKNIIDKMLQISITQPIK